MKKIKFLYSGAMLVLMLTLMSLTILPIFGCKAPPEVVTYKVEGVTINAVDNSMKAWGDYVRAGHAKQSEVDAVKKAYGQYYDAQMIAKAALEKYIASKSPADQAGADAANLAVAKAQGALLSLVVSLTQTK